MNNYFTKLLRANFRCGRMLCIPDEILREFYRRVSEAHIGSLKAFCI